jgi:hypothetical protein
MINFGVSGIPRKPDLGAGYMTATIRQLSVLDLVLRQRDCSVSPILI